jgi:DNA mismatch endonuclease (patch repair protein)
MAYWTSKISANQLRDSRNLGALLSGGWRVLTLWECEIRKFKGLEQKILDFMLG